MSELHSFHRVVILALLKYLPSEQLRDNKSLWRIKEISPHKINSQPMSKVESVKKHYFINYDYFI
jgi:hypothetical protein